MSVRVSAGLSCGGGPSGVVDLVAGGLVSLLGCFVLGAFCGAGLVFLFDSLGFDDLFKSSFIIGLQAWEAGSFLLYFSSVFSSV